eukprot:11595475-Alexandrium_andersonii.AAC.1
MPPKCPRGRQHFASHATFSPEPDKEMSPSQRQLQCTLSIRRASSPTGARRSPAPGSEGPVRSRA